MLIPSKHADNIAHTIRRILAGALGVCIEKCSDEAMLGEDLGIDEIDALEIALAVKGWTSAEDADQVMRHCMNPRGKVITVGQLIAWTVDNSPIPASA